MPLRVFSLLLALVCVIALPRVAQASTASIGECAEPSMSIDDAIELSLDESEDCIVDSEDPSTVPVCLSEGASAIASRIVHGIGDARVEAERRCSVFEQSDKVDSPNDKAPSKRPDKAPDARVDPELALAAFGSCVTQAPLRDQHDAPAGQLGGVYRPPRA